MKIDWFAIALSLVALGIVVIGLGTSVERGSPGKSEIRTETPTVDYESLAGLDPVSINYQEQQAITGDHEVRIQYLERKLKEAFHEIAELRKSRIGFIGSQPPKKE
ncbi:MAG: hypothetical protein AAFN70_12270 [Planctomycetota bacterium]